MIPQKEAEQQKEIPHYLTEYVNSKLSNGGAGRKHFFATVTGEPENVLLDILELAWIKGRGLASIGRKFKTKYHTIYRIIQDVEKLGHKDEIINFLMTTPRRKRFFIEATMSSDYETVQAFLRRAKRESMVTWRTKINQGAECWKFLKYKAPENWTAEDVLSYLATLTYGAKGSQLDGIRILAPQIANKQSPDYISVGKFRAAFKRRTCNLFGDQVKMIRVALQEANMTEHLAIFDLHITVAMREGSKARKGAYTSIKFEQFHDDWTRLDWFESKTQTKNLNAPVAMFFPDLPERIEQLWISRGRPANAYILKDDYAGLLKTYKAIARALVQTYAGRVAPDLLQEFANLAPHDADKIHVNMLWEAGIPLELVCGEKMGGRRAQAIFGRYWASTDIVRDHYLGLIHKTKKMKEHYAKVAGYARQFNGGD